MKKTFFEKISEKFSWKDAILIALTLTLGGIAYSKSISAAVRRGIRSSGRNVTKEEIDMRAFHTALYRLKKSKLMKRETSGKWRIEPKGLAYVSLLERRNAYREWQKKEKKNDAILVFDVPEYERDKRDLLRAELVALGFVPIQKSVWRGPSPLPLAFITYLRDTSLLPCVHIFRMQDEGTLSDQFG